MSRYVPHVCLECKAKPGEYYGRVVFPNEKAPPKCPVHKKPLTPAGPR